MTKMFENFDIWKDDNLEDSKPFMVACRDREKKDEERWVLVSLSNEEVEQIYKYLGKHLNKD